jgi:pyridoxamine 5'-phosphate oxidase family protein
VSLNQTEIDYLASQALGRLATVQPDGTLQNNPVGFRYNPDRATIDITGFNMAASRKFRNVADNGRVAFVVDDIVSTDPWRVRCLEIRGRAEAIDPVTAGPTSLDVPMIRIYPQRIISFGLDNLDVERNKLAQKRDV